MSAEMFAAHRALARALARLAPIYRKQAAAAQAPTDGKISVAGDPPPLLTDDEIDAAAFDRAVLRGKAVIVRLVKRCLGNRRNHQPSVKGPRRTNK